MSSDQINTSRRGALGLIGGAGIGLAAGCAQGSEMATTDPISSTDLSSAERVFGVNYTEAEREQMLRGMEDWVGRLEALRAYAKPNALAPACVFDPRLPGASYEMTSGGVTGLPTAPGAVADTDTDLAFAPVWQLSAWISSGAITSEALTQIYLARIEAYDSDLRAYITVMADQALDQARMRDRERAAGQIRSALHGIPYALKDIVDIAGVRATWGAQIYRDRIASQTATIAHMLEDAGAVLLGKTSVGALAYGDIWFDGVCRNPFNPSEGSSGSSAGSASATAAGLCAFSIGTETLGSIVSPSQRCGTAGLRPSFGRVSRHGAMALCWSLDKIGPIVRHVADAALVMEVINGYDANDPSSLQTQFGADLSADLSGLRLGYDPEAFEQATDADRAALDVARALGVELVETRPDLNGLPVDSLFSILEVEAAAAFEHVTLDNSDDELRWQGDNAWPNTFRRARFHSAIDILNADRVRRRAMEIVHTTFEGVDAMIGPNLANQMLLLTNFTGQPQLIFRSGFEDRVPTALFGSDEPAPTEPISLPHGTSLWAPLFKEDTILALGHELETRLGVATTRPTAFT